MRDPSLGVVPSEVYLLRHLSHPSMVRFVDYFHDQHYYYLVMSTVSEAAGSDLFDAIETERFSEAKARTIFAQLVSVFAYLHSHGVYHGDLKVCPISSSFLRLLRTEKKGHNALLSD